MTFLRVRMMPMSLTVEPGNDFINGLGGDDILNGGEGNDVLFGSSGDEMFGFENGTGDDQITDFATGCRFG